jgi:fluoroquinolone resistance protein
MLVQSVKIRDIRFINGGTHEMNILSSEDEIENITIEGLKAIGQDVADKLIFGCAFENCDFTEADFSSSRFEKCVFRSCNLSLIKTNDTSFQSTEFTDCKILGVNFTLCNPFALGICFSGSIINSCNFSGMKLRKSKFTECEIVDTDLINADLTEADFTSAKFRGAVFHNTNLSKAKFINAQGYEIHPMNNNIKKASFSLPDALTLIEQMDVIIK